MNDGRNGTKKSRKKIRTLEKKRKISKLGSGHYQTGGDERKKTKKKTIVQENVKTTRNQTTL